MKRKLLLLMLTFMVGIFAVNAQCNYTLELTDSWGDGWNGNTLDVIVDGVTTNYTLTNPPGNSQSYSIGVTDGGTIVLDYLAGGSYNNEVSFVLKDAGGAQLYSSGTDPTTGVHYSGSTSCPSCLAPSAQTETAISSSSATLGWTENGTASSWDIELGVSGFSPTGTPTQSGVINPYIYGSLIASTSYDWYVRADCGGTSSTWTGPSTFTTLQTPAPVQSLDYSEDWETNTIGAAWNYDAGSNGTIQTSTASAHDGTYGLAQYSDNSSFTTPSSLTDAYSKAQAGGVNEEWTTWNQMSIDLSTSTNPTLTFWYSMGYQYNNNYNNFWAQVSTDGSTWIDLFSTQTAGSAIAYEKKEFILSAYNGTAQLYIRFFHSGKYSTNYLYLDDISITDVSCPAPTAQTESSITTTSVILDWTTGGSANWDIEWGPKGFTQGSGTMVTNASKPYSIGTLTHSTEYDWYVRDSCGIGDVSTWTGPSTFSSACGSVTSYPFDEGFENTGSIPVCWSQEYVTGTTDWTFDNGGHSGHPANAQAGSYNALFYNSSGDITKLVSTSLDLSSGTSPILTFWHAQAAWSGDQDELRVYYKTSVTGAWTLIPNAEWTTDISDWTKVSMFLPHPSSDYYIAFEAKGDYGYGVVVDNVKVVATPPVPVSDWAIYIGILLIGGFIVVRTRNSFFG